MNGVAMLHNEQDIVSLPAGTVIFREGDPSDVMYSVVAGTVSIVHKGKEIEQIEEGGIFGEMAIVDGQPRSADAIAKTDAKLARISEERFMFLAKYNPYFTLDVLRVTVGRLRRRVED